VERRQDGLDRVTGLLTLYLFSYSDNNIYYIAIWLVCNSL